MKIEHKILLLIILFSLVILAGCNSNKSVPTTNEKQKITLPDSFTIQLNSRSLSSGRDIAFLTIINLKFENNVVVSGSYFGKSYYINNGVEERTPLNCVLDPTTKSWIAEDSADTIDRCRKTETLLTKEELQNGINAGWIKKCGEENTIPLYDSYSCYNLNK